jgi:putative ubiquitin-RnfH superfamily antitoxin RatB of RatAB toxin-antitoxin module
VANNPDEISVEVAYATPDRQLILSVSVPAGSTIEYAVRCSGILDEFPDIDLHVNDVGVFGNIAELETVLAPGDRVEIYRPLIADPKEIRRQRAATHPKSARSRSV